MCFRRIWSTRPFLVLYVPLFFPPQFSGLSFSFPLGCYCFPFFLSSPLFVAYALLWRCFPRVPTFHLKVPVPLVTLLPICWPSASSSSTVSGRPFSFPFCCFFNYHHFLTEGKDRLFLPSSCEYRSDDSCRG